MKRKLRVMLVEDHPEYREVIQLAIEEESDIELINQFGSAERALRSLQDRAFRKEPDLILLDLNLPGLSGLEALPYFRASIPDTKVIILTQSNKEADVLKGIQHGASGYLLKSSTVKEIIAAIRSVAAGGATIDQHIAKYILQSIQKHLPVTTLDKELSNRELETLHLLSEGLLKKEIADQLQISANTVSNYVVSIYEKLHVQNAAAAISKAYKFGILPFSD
ncbi:response regulator transcription factor [Pontiellaceae bacterium B1224]|nr:response regulator transcription factor [Pontiellaceae bacterium B1224]